jgi:glutathione S-transferase
LTENILFAVEGSYYAAKIRAYLMCKGIPFHEVQAERSVFEEHIVPRVGWPVVPVMITDQNETLQDTAQMIDFYEGKSLLPQLVPQAPRRRFVSYLLELLADEWIKLPALHYRWAYDHDFAVAMMGRNNDPQLPVAAQQKIGAKIAQRFSTWPGHLGVSDDNREAVEASYLELLQLLESHFQACNFILGEVPTLGDCALAGPLYAHLHHDPYPGKIMREHAPALCAWTQRIRHVEPVSATHTDQADDLPPTLMPVLAHLGRDYSAVLTTAMPLLQAWLGNNPVGEIPRYVGKHRFTVGIGKPYQAEGMRSIIPFEGWKVQRLMDVVRGLESPARQTVEKFCGEIEIADLLSLNFPNRLERRDFKLARVLSVQQRRTSYPAA